mmetsp:Transcript_257/g.254  ORF Transcript_257/g.254 Transcript_257/m.254 type:complete len:91 (+) Transcript_257:988-1260(+)
MKWIWRVTSPILQKIYPKKKNRLIRFLKKIVDSQSNVASKESCENEEDNNNDKDSIVDADSNDDDYSKKVGSLESVLMGVCLSQHYVLLS